MDEEDDVSFSFSRPGKNAMQMVKRREHIDAH
jgi:hypothetical protein